VGTVIRLTPQDKSAYREAISGDNGQFSFSDEWGRVPWQALCRNSFYASSPKGSSPTLVRDPAPRHRLGFWDQPALEFFWAAKSEMESHPCGSEGARLRDELAKIESQNQIQHPRPCSLSSYKPGWRPVFAVSPISRALKI
jgi:hypothetical protein